MRKTLPREAKQGGMLLPSFMQENNNSRMNLLTLNSKALRENSFSSRDFYSPKSGFQGKQEFDAEIKNKNRMMRRTTDSRFIRKKKKSKEVDSDFEDSLSELFHKHDL